MDLQLPISITPLPYPMRYGQKLLLVGSCFTGHIGGALEQWKFDVLQNPNGILFDPASVASSLQSYIEPERYGPEDLFFANDVWQSWKYHGTFSGTDRETVLEGIRASQGRAHVFLKQADWLIITLGSSFSYRLKEGGMAVANCHRMPQQVFDKHLMTIEETVSALDGCLHRLFYFNPKIRVLFTVSPVRHIRDGVVENNRSKARLIESVHHLVSKYERLWYFPAYELVIDVLRDYRFFDIDMVHPNYAATQFVLEKFTEACIDPESRRLLEEVRQLVVARRHRPRHPSTAAHARFLQEHYEKAAGLARRYPFLRLEEELLYFSAGI
ncbi:MAG TPA: GSCFA domain-containing protein [Puia sp.]|nr:GSCFA domain-containing protein [Puia sp.]